MARDQYVKTVDEIWASSSNANANLNVREGETALVFEDGWEETYGAAGGAKSTRSQFNYFNRLTSAMAKEINENGCLLEWDATIAYTTRARVIGSNGVEYKAVQASTGEDPVADSSNTNWTRMIPVPPAMTNASESQFGVVRYATSAEVNAGTSPDRVGSIANISSMINAVVSGRLLPATHGTSGQFLRHDGTYADLPSSNLPDASTTTKGVVELATQAEAQAGNSSNVVPTVERVTQQVNTMIPMSQRLPAADGTSGQFLGHEGDYLDLPVASTTQQGVATLATAAQVEGGQANRVVTGSVLPIRKVVTYTPTQDVVAVNVAGTLHLKTE